MRPIAKVFAMDSSTQDGGEFDPDQSVDHAVEVFSGQVTTVEAVGALQDIAVASFSATEDGGGAAGGSGVADNAENAREEVEPDDTAVCEPSVGSAVTGVSNEAEVVEQLNNRDTSSGPQEIGATSVGSLSDPGSAIIPPKDDRVRIYSTDKYPWSTHASLLITARDNTQYSATASFAGPDTLITGGHCVYINGPDEDKNGWVKSIKVMPGRNGHSMPFGYAYATHVYSVKGWTKRRKYDYDYGAIKISKSMGTGWLGGKAYKASDLRGKKLYTAGYPGDKPEGTQWFQVAKVTRVTARNVYYDSDTFHGQSGSAVYRIEDGEKRYCFAIHVHGTKADPPKENRGTRLTNAVVKNVIAWKKD